MAKLNFGDLRQEAINLVDTQNKAAADRKRQIDEIYAHAYETSVDGTLGLLKLANLSLVSEACPAEIPLKNEFQSTGREAVLQMDDQGNWSASLSKEYDGPAQPRSWFPGGRSRVSIVDAIADAAGIPLVGDACKTIGEALNPIKDRDFDHLNAVLDRIPLKTLSSMLGHGPLITSSLGIGIGDKKRVTTHIVDGVGYSEVEYTDDVAKLAVCIGDAIVRRMAPAVDHGMEIRHMVAKVRKQAQDPAQITLQIPGPACMSIITPHTPAQTIKDFLHQAVRVGFDINAVDGFGGDVPTAAHRAVKFLSVKDLKALVALGLDLEFADSLSSLTDVVVDRLCARSDRTMLTMLKHLVTKVGLKVDKESYQTLMEALCEANRRDRDAWLDEDKDTKRERQQLIELLESTVEFLNEKFPSLHKKTRRKAA